MGFSFNKSKPTASLVIRSNAIDMAWDQAGKAPGTIRVPVDTSGDANLVQAIRQAIEEGQIKVSRLAVSIQSNDVLVRYFSMPTLPKSELESAVAFEARKYIPFKMESLVWDCYYSTPAANGSGRQNAPAQAANTEVVFAGLPKEGFVRFQSILAVVGIQVVAIEPLSQSLARLVASDAQQKEAFDCILDLAKDRAQLIIAKKGVLYLTRDIQWSSIEGDITPAVLDSKEERLLSELRVSMDFFRREHPSTTFTAVTCFGEQELVARCTQALSNQLPCPVVSGNEQVAGSVLDKDTLIHFGPALGLLKAAEDVSSIPLNFLRRGNVGEAIGASSSSLIPAQGAINLNPAELLAMAKNPQVGLTALSLGALVCALLWGAGATQVSRAEHQLKQLQAQTAAISDGMGQMNQTAIKSIQDKAKDQLKFLKVVIDQRTLVSEKLDAIVRALPDGVWLTGLNYESRLELTGKSKAVKASSAHLSLSGACFLGGSNRELSAIQELETRLKNSQKLAENLGSIRLGKIDSTTDSQQNTSYRIFQLSAQDPSGRL